MYPWQLLLKLYYGYKHQAGDRASNIFLIKPIIHNLVYMEHKAFLVLIFAT